jgi:nitronate monooxygenase
MICGSIGELDYMPVWAGEGVDMISELDSAAALVTRIAQGAERAIKTFCE